MTASDRIELPNSIHHIPHGSVAKRRTNENQWIELTLAVRRAKNLPDLSALDLVRPAQRKYLTVDKLEKEYGSDPGAVARIEAFAKANRLSVVRDDRGAATLGLGGTVADVTAAFGVTLFDYDNAALGQFHARTGPVMLPANLKDDVTGVFGFNNHRILRRRKNHLAPATVAAATTLKARAWFVPTELAPIYDFPTADVSNQCIALLEFGGGVDEADLADYFKKIEVPAPNVQVIALNGVSTDPSVDPDSTGEVMLDVEVVGALAPGAKVAVYFSTFDEKGLVDAIAAVIADKTNAPKVVSISWGWDENQPFQSGILWSQAAIDHVNQSFLAASQLGITVCVSTGDDGSEAQIKDGRAHVCFPASSPYVLAVGGTTLHVRKTAKGQSTLREVVWNDGPGSGTGGGVSDLIPVPTWQREVAPPSINPGAFRGRAIPDVAANADPNTGYLTKSNGQFGIVGGTSAAAPLWAALVTRINASANAQLGNFNALLYTKYGPAGVLRDIDTGNNDTDGLLGGQFRAGPGWDACTGWGVPDGKKLLTAI
jgi:kumamolisin